MRGDFTFEVEVEGADAASLLEHAVDMGESDLAVGGDAWGPKRIVKMDVRKRDGVQLAFGGHGSSFDFALVSGSWGVLYRMGEGTTPARPHDSLAARGLGGRAGDVTPKLRAA